VKPFFGRSISQHAETIGKLLSVNSSGTKTDSKESVMRETRAMSGRGLLALICSLLIAFPPISAASDSAPIAGANSTEQIQSGDALALAETMAAVAAVTLPLNSPGGPSSAPESIAVAKLTGAADRNGQPLLNGSIVSSGDLLTTHGDSALLLTSTPHERLWFGPNTSAKLTKEAENVAVALEHGTLGFQTRGHIQVTFENHDGLALRSRPGSPALAQLSFVNNQEAQVRLQEGSLELVQGSHSVLLQPEKSGSSSASDTQSVGEPATKQNSGAQAESAKQSGTGSINGTVVNSQLFVVSGANVTLTDAAGKTLTTTSNHSGNFFFNDVPTGNYSLHVAQAGFQTYELPNVVVRAGNESTLYVKLGGVGAVKKNNNLLLWIVIGAAAAGGIGAYLGTRGSSSSSTSPSSVQ
jgi:Carboxypeptidase regulatory-like domain